MKLLNTLAVVKQQVSIQSFNIIIIIMAIIIIAIFGSAVLNNRK